jgi:hypothetical protein
MKIDSLVFEIDKPELQYQHDRSQEAKVWVFPSCDCT